MLMAKAVLGSGGSLRTCHLPHRPEPSSCRSGLGQSPVYCSPRAASSASTNASTSGSISPDTLAFSETSEGGRGIKDVSVHTPSTSSGRGGACHRDGWHKGRE